MVRERTSLIGASGWKHGGGCSTWCHDTYSSEHQIISSCRGCWWIAKLTQRIGASIIWLSRTRRGRGSRVWASWTILEYIEEDANNATWPENGTTGEAQQENDPNGRMPSQLPTGIQVISRVYQSVKKAGKDRIEEMLGQASHYRQAEKWQYEVDGNPFLWVIRI